MTTVSLFVKGKDDVCSPATAERIRAAVKELHYTPSSLVSGMQTRVTSTLGVCMLNPMDQHVAFGNQFFERLWRGVLAQADAENHALLYYPGSVRDGTRYEPFLDGRVDGVLFHVHKEDNLRPAQVASAGMPTVLLARGLDIPEGCGAVIADESRTADLALSHLWELGHRRISHVAGPVDRKSGLEPFTSVDDIAVLRLNAYTAWMTARGVADPSLIGWGRGWRGDSVDEIVQGWTSLPEPPTAVFCANDTLATKVIESARRRGLRVPEDISVVGVDNSGIGREYNVPLTTIDVNGEAVGRESVRALFRIMNGAPLKDCQVTLSASELIVRESTAPCATRSE